MKLNLKPQGKEQELLLSYLEQNASETLAEKIINGVAVTKNGTQLIMKKDLTGFMKYASEEAKKVAAKGANYACIEDKTVFGWMMHYFEEDSIEGSYYNLDGTPYTPPKKETKKTAPAAPQNNPKPQPKQEAELTLFDMLTAATTQDEVIQESKSEPIITEPAEDTFLDPLEESKDLPPVAYPSELDPTADEIQAVVDEYNRLEAPVVDLEETPEKLLSAHYEKWLEIQKQYPQALILVLIADENSMEIYGEHAKAISEMLMLKLDSRDFGEYGELPRVRFPYEDFERYFDLMNTRYEIAFIYSLEGSIVHYPKKEEERQWLTGTAYADKDGVVHETNPAIDTAAMMKLQKLIGDILIVR